MHIKVNLKRNLIVFIILEAITRQKYEEYLQEIKKI